MASRDWSRWVQDVVLGRMASASVVTGSEVSDVRGSVNTFAHWLRVLDTYLIQCESPIEQLVFVALSHAPGWSMWSFPRSTRKVRAGHSRLGLYVIPQLVVGPSEVGMAKASVSARLDFAVVRSRIVSVEVQEDGETVDSDALDEDCSLRIAVECDGHDYHERTREQAERDRSRDRELQKSGWVVMRFTGREIHRDPLLIAKQVEEMALTRIPPTRQPAPATEFG